jgi:hypothetical protein
VDERVEKVIKGRGVKKVMPEMKLPEKGYCEICCLNYADGEAHRATPGHQGKLEAGVWREFDEIARSMPMM